MDRVKVAIKRIDSLKKLLEMLVMDGQLSGKPLYTEHTADYVITSVDFAIEHVLRRASMHRDAPEGRTLCERPDGSFGFEVASETSKNKRG